MKCGKVKNPCKICYQSVSNKNGLQCKGACKKWAHYKCLEYTPGKISDIKAGYIKITCPCPDCSTTEPREITTKPNDTCKKDDCPARKAPKCEVPECPSKEKPIPSFCPPPPTPKPAAGCGTPEPKCQSSPKISPCSSPSPRQSPCPSPPQSPAPQLKISVAKRQCPPCPTHCPKVASQKSGSDTCFPQGSSSSLTRESSDSDKSRVGMCSSDSALLSSQDQKILTNIVEEMCGTVGQLSCQMKELMCKMAQTFKNSRQ